MSDIEFKFQYEPNHGYHFIEANGVGGLYQAKSKGPRETVKAFSEHFQETLTVVETTNKIAAIWIDSLLQKLTGLHIDLINSSTPIQFKLKRKDVWELNKLVKIIGKDQGFNNVIEEIKSTEEILFGKSLIPTSPSSNPLSRT